MRARAPAAAPGRGFTLVELVVVLGIFAVMSMMAYGGLSSVLDTRRAVERSLDRTAALQRAYLRLRDDLQQVSLRPARNAFGEAEPALLLHPDDRLEFTRAGWRNPLGHPRSSLERVSYRLDEDRRLLREHWRVLDRAQDSEPLATVLLEQVDEVTWRFLETAEQWESAWPPLSQAAPGQLPPPPAAVELTLRLRDLGEVRLLFRPGAKPHPS